MCVCVKEEGEIVFFFHPPRLLFFLSLLRLLHFYLELEDSEE